MRSTLNYGDPDIEMARVVSFSRVFNDACDAKGVWGSKIYEYVFSLMFL